MKNKSIFSNQCQRIHEAFMQAGTPEKVLLVPLDFAKLTHWVCFCDGYGQYIRKPFTVHNDKKGVDYLIQAVEKTRKARGIRSYEHVVIGGEDSASYTQNFMAQLKQHGYLAVQMNAHEVHRQAENIDSSTDKTALKAIARTMLNRNAKSVEESDELSNLRELTRQRRRLIRLTTAVKNRIHTQSDRLFPGFLAPQSAIPAFSQASIELMRATFSARWIGKKSLKQLHRQLQRYRVKDAQQAAQALKTQAQNAIALKAEAARITHELLHGDLELYTTLQANSALLDKQIARVLSRTSAAFLTSIRGIGITLAASIVAETGDLTKFSNTDAINAYAGIIPKVKQTGGPQQQASVAGKRQRFNRILKDYLLQAGNHLYLHGPNELMEDARARKASGRAVETAMARRFIRIGKSLMRTQFIYLPDHLRCDNDQTGRQGRMEYLEKIWPDWLIKWKRLEVAKQAFGQDTPIGLWRIAAQKIYDLKLPL